MPCRCLRCSFLESFPPGKPVMGKHGRQLRAADSKPKWKPDTALGDHRLFPGREAERCKKGGSRLLKGYSQTGYTYSPICGCAHKRITMKTKHFNLFLKFLRQLLAVDFTKNEQVLKTLRPKRKVSRYRLHEVSALYPSGRQSEAEMTTLVADDRGFPHPLGDGLLEASSMFSFPSLSIALG